MKTYQLRDLDQKDLEQTLKDNLESLENFRFRHATGQLENYMSLPNAKKTIARAKTILTERELGINNKTKTKK